MRRNPRFRHLNLGLALFSLGMLIAGSPAVADDSATDAPSTAGASVAAPAPNAVTITWNAAERRFEAPTAEQAAVLASEFQRFLAARMAAGGPLAPAKLQTEKLANGLTRARLPLEYMNLSVVRVGSDGSFVESCGPAAEAAELLQPAPAATLEVE